MLLVIRLELNLSTFWSSITHPVAVPNALRGMPPTTRLWSLVDSDPSKVTPNLNATVSTVLQANKVGAVVPNFLEAASRRDYKESDEVRAFGRRGSTDASVCSIDISNNTFLVSSLQPTQKRLSLFQALASSGIHARKLHNILLSSPLTYYDLANLAWCLAKTEVNHPRTFHLLSLSLPPPSAPIDWQVLSSVCYSVQKASYHVPDLLDLLDSLDYTTLPPQYVTSISMLLAKSGHYCAPFFSALSGSKGLRFSDPMEILWSLCVLGKDAEHPSLSLRLWSERPKPSESR